MVSRLCRKYGVVFVPQSWACDGVFWEWFFLLSHKVYVKLLSCKELFNLANRKIYFFFMQNVWLWSQDYDTNTISKHGVIFVPQSRACKGIYMSRNSYCEKNNLSKHKNLIWAQNVPTQSQDDDTNIIPQMKSKIPATWCLKIWITIFVLDLVTSSIWLYWYTLTMSDNALTVCTLFFFHIRLL